MSNHSDPIAWMDREDVLAVVFNPRSEADTSDRPKNGRRLTIPVAGNVTLSARFYAADRADPVLIFFHGNGEIVADYDPVAGFYTKRHINFFPVDYRGYGKSTGQPTVTTMLQDADTAFNFARDWLKKNGHTGPLIVMGRSLGSTSALEVVCRHPGEAAGLIIDSGIAFVVPLLVRLGADLSASDRRHTEALRQTHKIAAYKGPTLIIHGEQDQVIPIADAEALHAASAGSPKTFLRIPDGNHNNLMLVAYNDYMAAISNLVEKAKSKG